MKHISREEFLPLMKQARIKQRLQRELRFVPETIAWQDLEMLAITTRSGNEGVLFVEEGDLAVVPFEIKRALTDTRIGRSKPIICDFCHTWQRGGNAASITFVRNSQKSVTFLCCADLACSLHVRDRTPEAVLSRTQLHEDMTTVQRIARLRRNLHKITNL